MSNVVTDSIQSKAQSALASSEIYDLRVLQVDHRDGRIVLSGSVSRFYYKQLAQELIFSACPSHDVVNAISVR
ncbi:MAG: hypothetical protein JW818_07420 [Pirellulales bacterium]|nr:hypothetical protein [Pirellulales bacterium]